MNNTAPAVSDREIITTRVLDTPRERVFRAWTDPAILARWWGPKGFTNTFRTFEPQPGGRWHFTMHGPNEVDYRNRSVFLEVVPPERIVFDHLGPMHRFRVTVTFTAEGDRTRLVWRMLFTSVKACDKVRAFIPTANEENLDRMEAELGRMD